MYDALVPMSHINPKMGHSYAKLDQPGSFAYISPTVLLAACLEATSKKVTETGDFLSKRLHKY